MKKSTATTMRRIAGVLFGALFVYGIVGMKFVIEGAGIGNGPFSWTIEVGMLLLAAGFSAWLLAKDTELSPALRRAVPTVSVLAVLFELVTFESQTTAINYTLTNWFPGDGVTQPDFGIWKFVILGVKLMLIILAAFFVTCAKEDDGEDEEKVEEMLEAAVVAEVIAEEVEKVAAAEAIAEEATEKEENK